MYIQIYIYIYIFVHKKRTTTSARREVFSRREPELNNFKELLHDLKNIQNKPRPFTQQSRGSIAKLTKGTCRKLSNIAPVLPVSWWPTRHTSPAETDCVL